MGEAGTGWKCERKTWKGVVSVVRLLRTLLSGSEVGREVEEGKKLES
jgi:hypothetical protein